MPSKLFYHYFFALAIAALWEMSSFSVFSSNAHAQIFEPPSGNPTPKTTIGGGRRGSDGQCLKEQNNYPRTDKTKQSLEQQLLPLLPPNQFGLTVSATPTFFAYIPKTSAIAVEFTLENSQGKGIAHKRIELTNTPSIVNVQFDKTQLEIEKDYKWLISVVCETGDPEDTFSEGIIRRIKPSPSLLNKLEKASAIERVSIYAKFGIWHESISGLANLRLSQPNSRDLNISWLNLLKSTNLESIASTPLKNYVDIR